MRKRGPIACFAVLAIGPFCALTPQFKAFYLSAHDWRGAELSGHGRLTVADALAGAGPSGITLLEVGGLLNGPRDPERRMRLQDERGLALTAALERQGVAPAEIGVEALTADGSLREPPQPLLAKKMIVVVHY